MRELSAYLSILGIVAFFLTTCKKENPCADPTNPACPNYNPCSVIRPLSADFIIQEEESFIVSDSFWHFYPTDTISTNYARFIVKDKSVDSYEVEYRCRRI